MVYQKKKEPGRIYFNNILFDIINRDLFKKIRDTKGIFHVKMGTVKDRNWKELTATEEINKRWQEYTEELYQKGLNDLANDNGVVTHLELDILEREISSIQSLSHVRISATAWAAAVWSQVGLRKHYHERN